MITIVNQSPLYKPVLTNKDFVKMLPVGAVFGNPESEVRFIRVSTTSGEDPIVAVTVGGYFWQLSAFSSEHPTKLVEFDGILTLTRKE